jgi:anti-sigma B factor antagonist
MENQMDAASVCPYGVEFLTVATVTHDEKSRPGIAAAAAPRRRQRNVAVVTVEGPLRAPVSGRLREGVEFLLERGERAIVLDLARVMAVDAAGLGELVRAYNMASAAGGRLRVVDAPRRVRELIDLSRLSAVFAAEPALGCP